ncbi:MAG: hypothetical protein HYV16_14150 [Gammaproteobacteria bacterium]|nr:hypothetical protein [Gammaproteobacteria bacterium]
MSRLPAWCTPGLAAVLASALLSALAWLLAGAPNDDGILYLLTAREFPLGGWHAAFEAYGWPFYSVLLAGLSGLGLPLETAGQLLNLGSFALLAWAFVGVVRELYPERPAWAWLAVPVVILLPELNAQRADLIRDNAYLAFWLLSLWALLRLARQPGPGRFAAWLACLALAQAFRLEAVAFVLCGALALAAQPRTRRLGLALGVVLLVILPLLAWILPRFMPASRLADFGLWWQELRHQAPAQFLAASERLGAAVLNQYSQGFEREAYLAVLLTVLAGKLLKIWTPVHALCLWLGRRGLAWASLPAAWRGYALAALLLPLIFVLFRQFLTARFLMPLVLCLLLLAPPVLAELARRLATRPRLLCVLALGLGLLFLGGSLRQLRDDDRALVEAGRWLAAQPGDLWTNHSALSYYAGRNTAQQHVHGAWRAWREQMPANTRPGWRALALSGKERREADAWLARLGGREVRRFEDGKYLVIVTQRE